MPINPGDMVYHGAEVVFTATPDEGYRIQQWIVNDEPLADFTDASYTVPVLEGQLDVSVEFELIVGIDQPAETQLSAFPNPFNSSIKLSGASDIKYVVFTNSLGKEVKRVKLDNSGVISTDDLPSGFYILVIHANDGNQIIKKMMKRDN